MPLAVADLLEGQHVGLDVGIAMGDEIALPDLEAEGRLGRRGGRIDARGEHEIGILHSQGQHEIGLRLPGELELDDRLRGQVEIAAEAGPVLLRQRLAPLLLPGPGGQDPAPPRQPVGAGVDRVRLAAPTDDAPEGGCGRRGACRAGARRASLPSRRASKSPYRTSPSASSKR